MRSSLLRGLCLSLTLLALALLAGTPLSNAQGKGGKKPSDLDGDDDMPNRARWVWTLSSPKGKEIDSGTFMGYKNGEIKHGMNKIGTFTMPAKKRVKAIFTEGKLEGTANLQMTDAKPVTYEGEIDRKKGGKGKLVVKIIND